MATDAVTARELAAYLKLSVQTVYRRFRQGKLPGMRVGQAIWFRRDVIDAWLRVMSRPWDRKQRDELLAWAEQFAQDLGWQEQDVLAAVRARRKRPS